MNTVTFETVHPLKFEPLVPIPACSYKRKPITFVLVVK